MDGPRRAVQRIAARGIRGGRIGRGAGAGAESRLCSFHAQGFKELFNQKYFPEELRNEKESEFLRLTQGSMSLVEYERKFEQCSRFALYLIDTEWRKINRFVGGLKSYIRKHVRVLGLMTYADLLHKAQILEKEDEIAINAKSKEKVHSPQQKKPWNKNF
ncbi:hypothetical protein QYF36_012149 [Acer negundo]|nr:hypothetical protein QYF36_012149 [Acer negundo]